MDDAPIRIGVSACLLGEPVRWDGGHKRDPFLVEQLGPCVEWVPVCPEVELGMGTPREPVQLARGAGGVRLVAQTSGTDWTERMQAWARRRVRALERLDLCGYVLKKSSPSCGLERVAVRGARGVVEQDGRGLFAGVLASASPALPIEEEDRLHDPRLRDNWIERVFAYRRLRSFFAEPWTSRSLARFHAAHELQLMAHAPRRLTALGGVVAEAEHAPPAALRARYEADFMEALRRLATPRRHVEVLKRVLGELRGRLGADDGAALADLVRDYGRGGVPLAVPVALLHGHAHRLGLDALAGQVYLAPHPTERMLRERG